MSDMWRRRDSRAGTVHSWTFRLANVFFPAAVNRMKKKRRTLTYTSDSDPQLVRNKEGSMGERPSMGWSG